MTDKELLCKVFPGQREALCALYDKTGSLDRLFNMTESEVLSAGCTDEYIRTILPCMAEISRRFLIASANTGETVTSSESAARVLGSYFAGVREEMLVVAHLSGRGSVVNVSCYKGGTTDGIAFSIPKITRDAVSAGAKAVILAHNHPDGFAIPSRQDLEQTKNLSLILADAGIKMCEHIIFAGDDKCFLSGFEGTSYLVFQS